MDDLFKALEMFKSGVQQYAITGAVNDANATMQQLNQSQIDEGQKRQQLQQLANSLALQLTGANASGTQIQSAFNAINPQNFGSVEQLQLEGQLAGNDYLTSTANKILGERQQAKIAEENRLYGRQVGLSDRQFQQQLMLEGLKAQQKGTQNLPNFQIAPGVKLTEKDQEELKASAASYEALRRGLERMDTKVDKVGTEFIGGIPAFGGGVDKKELLQERDSVMLQLKELAKLGALTGPDVDAMAKIIPDPTALSTSIYEAQSRAFKSQLDDRLQSQAMARGVRYTGKMFSNNQNSTQSAINNINPQIKMALEWAKANANDPKAQRILMKYGGG